MKKKKIKNPLIRRIPVSYTHLDVYKRQAYDYDDLLASFEKKLDEKITLLKNGTYNLGPVSYTHLAFLSSFVMLYLTNTVGLNPGIIGTLIMVSKPVSYTHLLKV